MEITKFEKNGCMLCKRMDMILKELGIKYKAINLDDVEEAESFIEKYNLSSLPAIVKTSGDDFSVLEGAHSPAEIKEFCESPYMTNVMASKEPEFHCENGNCGI